MYKMTTEIANACFASGLDCSQVVFGYAAELVNLDPDEARKITSPFGGGMWLGETCGCITGALMAIGYKYGHFQAGDTKAKESMLAKKAEFEKKFKAKHESLICKELLGYDLSKPEELNQLVEEKLHATLCPVLACDTCGIVSKMLEEN